MSIRRSERGTRQDLERNQISTPLEHRAHSKWGRIYSSRAFNSTARGAMPMAPIIIIDRAYKIKDACELVKLDFNYEWWMMNKLIKNKYILSKSSFSNVSKLHYFSFPCSDTECESEISELPSCCCSISDSPPSSSDESFFSNRFGNERVHLTIESSILSGNKNDSARNTLPWNVTKSLFSRPFCRVAHTSARVW